MLNNCITLHAMQTEILDNSDSGGKSVVLGDLSYLPFILVNIFNSCCFCFDHLCN